MNDAAVRQFLESAVVSGAFPGATYAFGTASEFVSGAIGFRDESQTSAATTSLLYDLASMTKVIATTSVAMRLSQEGYFDVDDPVQLWLPGFAHPEVTVRMLLIHTSGLAAHARLDELGLTSSEAWRALERWPLDTEAGTRQVYSCLGFLILGRMLNRVLMGGKFDIADESERARMWELFVEMNVLRPLGMPDTMFNPLRRFGRDKLAPTEGDLCGEVHDENARFLGGIVGNAGLFGPVEDVARFAQALLLRDGFVFDSKTLDVFTRQAESDPLQTRALGWDTRSAQGSSAGSRFGARSFGHTGFTGTSIWIDPDAGFFGVLLTNRVHPTRDREGIVATRPLFYDLVFEALSG